MRFRAPVPEDAPSVLAVLEARDRADLGLSDYTLEDLVQEWRGAELDLAGDAVVVEDATGRIVAYAIVRRPGALVAISPGHEGQGVGTQLLALAERRERELRRPRHRQWIGSGNARAAALLRAAGYAHERSYWRMTRRVEGHGEPVPVPEGVSLRPPDLERDAPALHGLDAVSFSGNPDYEPEPYESFCEEHLHVHDLARELSLVAEQDGQMTGFLLTRRWEHESSGYIDLLAVHPERRRRGLGSAMLGTAFAACAAAGLRETQLNVASDNPRALTLYERAGMSVRFRVDTYERPI